MASEFEIATQEQHNWCWAAVGMSIDRYFSPDSTMKQCEVAERVVGTGCCGNPENCNRAAGLEQALKAVKRLKAVLVGGILTFGEVRERIDTGLPVCARIGWPEEGRGHFVVIFGYSTSSQGEWVHIADPFFLDSTIPYEQFVSSYLDAGAWTDTFLVTDRG